MKKLLLGLGVPKAGTTWLFNALRQHPDIGTIPRKEIHYFLRQYSDTDRLTETARLSQFAQHCRRFELVPPHVDQRRVMPLDADLIGSAEDAEIRKRWQPGGSSLRRYETLMAQIDWYKGFLKGPVDDDWYRGLFRDVPDTQWACDFSTSSFRASDRGYAALAQFAEDTRAILILRDPIDRLWSHIRFHAEVTNDFDNLEVWSTPAIRDFTAHHGMETMSLYAEAVERLIRHFPADRRLIINFDDIVARPESVFAGVQTFLNLAPVALPAAIGRRETMAASRPLKMRRGLLAHLAPAFIEDLERVRAMGIDFVAPWITHARAHQAERPEPDPFGALSIGRRVYRRLKSDMSRRRRHKVGRFSGLNE